jgi:hypothetical protein
VKGVIKLQKNLKIKQTKCVKDKYLHIAGGGKITFPGERIWVLDLFMDS